MYEFIRLQYRMGRITAGQVIAYAPRWITDEQASEIIGEAGEKEVYERADSGIPAE